jgi:hypothetical protein
MSAELGDGISGELSGELGAGLGGGRAALASLVARLDTDSELLEIFRAGYPGEGDALEMLTRRRDGLDLHEGMADLARAAYSRHETVAGERRAVAALARALDREASTGRALDAAIAAVELATRPPETPDVPEFRLRHGTRSAVTVALAVVLFAVAATATTYRPDSLAVFDTAPTAQNLGAPDARAAATRAVGYVEDVRLIGRAEGLDVFAFLDPQFGVCLSVVDANRAASGSCTKLSAFRERGLFVQVNRRSLTAGTDLSIFWGPVGTLRIYPYTLEEVFRGGLETRLPTRA